MGLCDRDSSDYGIFAVCQRVALKANVLGLMSWILKIMFVILRC